MKLKDLLNEAFEGIGGIVTLKPIHHLENKKPVNETIPAFPKEFKDFEKASVVYAKSIEKLIKALAKAGHKKEAVAIKKQYAIKVDSDFENLIDNTLSKLS